MQNVIVRKYEMYIASKLRFYSLKKVLTVTLEHFEGTRVIKSNFFLFWPVFTDQVRTRVTQLIVKKEKNSV